MRNKFTILAWLSIEAIALLCALCQSSTARAEPFRLAINTEHGALLPRNYTFAASLQPGFDLGRLRVAASAGAVFRNPDWSPAIGARVSLVLWAPATLSTGARIVADATYMTKDSWRGLGGIALDLESIQLGALGGYDSYHQAAVFLTTLAFDIPTIWRFFAGAPFESAPACRKE